MPKKILYLIDGANYVFRAYYAIRPLSTSKGLPTNALYGFTQMLLKLLREEKPDHIAVVFDTKEPTFRDEMYKDYKSNRPPPPDDLIEQFPYLKMILEALNIPALELAGFEADDIIGTLAKKLASDELNVVIVSGDKDLMQLVGGPISMYDSMKDRRIGEKEVQEQFGVEPSKVVDVLGLAGDSSDNIPGIAGIGLATASRLIRQFESLENVLDNADKLSGGLAYKVKRDANKARLSKELAKIKTDVPIKYRFEDFAVSPPDDKKLHELFRELEFSKLLSELSPKETLGREGYCLIQTESALGKLIDEIKGKGQFSFDLETTSLDVMDAEIVGISIATEPGKACYIPVGHVSGTAAKDLFGKFKGLVKGQMGLGNVIEKLKPVLSDPKIRKIGQNLKYDLAVLKRYNVSVGGLYCDTMIASYLLNPGGTHNMDALAQTHLDHRTIRYEEVTGKGKKQISFAEVPIETARDYSCEDADVALRLSDIFIPKLKENKLDELFFNLEMPLIMVLLDMEQAGMKIDTERLSKLSGEFDARLKELEGRIYDEAKEEFNINSPRQLGAVLFDKLKLGTPKRTKTGYSTDVGILEDLSLKHSLPGLILEYRSLSKLKSGYIDALPQLVNKKTGRIHTSFNQTVAATGRLSSSDPNLQNIPARTKEGAKIREAFIAEKGNVLISADYSQIELRVLAHLSKDSALLEAFKRGEDVHRITAAGIFGAAPDKVTDEQRAVGKTVNFATIYGQTPFGLSKQLKIEVNVAAEYIDAYFKRYPAVEKYRDHVISRAKRNGFVETLFGRRRLVPDINSKNAAVRQAVERMAFNSVFQGTAADIIKKAMVNIHAELPKKFPHSKMIMQVHDELLFEAPEKNAESLAAWAKGIMENVVDIEVPLVADVGIGPNWSAAH
jgi:DNA polymerase-1